MTYELEERSLENWLDEDIWFIFDIVATIPSCEYDAPEALTCHWLHSGSHQSHVVGLVKFTDYGSFIRG